MERGERFFWSVMGALLMFLTGLIMWQVMQTDFSLRQTEHRRKFGAVYMTLNNPFYEIVDEEIRMEVERRYYAQNIYNREKHFRQQFFPEAHESILKAIREGKKDKAMKLLDFDIGDGSKF